MEEQLPEQSNADEAEPTTSKIGRILARVGALVLGVIWLGPVGLMVSLAFGMARSELRKPFVYRPVEAVVTKYTPPSTHTDDFEEKTHTPGEITYSYEVAGRAYTDTFSQPKSPNEHTSDLMGRVAVGTKVKAWYDPGDPSRSTLRPIASPLVLSFIMFLMPFLAVGLGMIFYGVTSKGPKFQPRSSRPSGSRSRGVTVSGGGPYTGTYAASSAIGAFAFFPICLFLPWWMGWLVGIGLIVLVIPLLTWRIGGYFKRRSQRKAQAKAESAASAPPAATPAPVQPTIQVADLPRTGQKLPGCGKMLLGMTAVTLFWCGITGVFVGFACHSILKHLEAQKRFVAVEGEVIASKVKTDTGDDSTTYKPLVKYRYVVAGREYTSMRYSYDSFSSSDSSWAYRVVKEHPPGAKVTVYCDPEEPSDAVLQRDVPSMSYFLLLFVQPFVMVGLGLIACTISIPIAHTRARAFVSEPSVLPESIPGWGTARREMGGWVIRGGGAWYAPFVALGAGYALTCFVGIFVVVLAFGGPEEADPDKLFTIFAIAGGVGVMAMLVTLLRGRRKAKLLIDPQLRRFSLTGPNRNVELRFTDIAGWIVRTIPDPRGVRVNDKLLTCPLLLLVTTTDGREEPVHVFRTRGSQTNVAEKVAQAFAEMTGKPLETGQVIPEEAIQADGIADALKQAFRSNRKQNELRKQYRDIM